MKFLKHESGGVITLIPDGKLLCTLEEFAQMEADRDRWRDIACALYNAAQDTDSSAMREALAQYEDAERD